MKTTNPARMIACCLCIVAFLSPRFDLSGQTPGAPTESPADEFQVASVGNPISERVTARDEMQAFLEARQWHAGHNQKPDGTHFFVAASSAAINASRSHPRFMESRLIAFEKAMLEAKARLAEYLQITITTRAIFAYSENQTPAPPPAEGEAPDILEKLSSLAHKKLDDLLRIKGIDPSGPEAKAEVEKAKMTDDFLKFTRKASQAYITGFQAFQTFEVYPDGKNGEIAVVGIVSDKLRSLSAALAGGSTPPPQKPGKIIVDQLPTAGPALLCSFGIRQLVDENGQQVLVAFGQSHPISESSRAELAAEEKAQMQAESALRSFAGESMTTARDLFNAESYKEFEDNTSTYENQSAYRARVESFGEGMRISGIQVIKRWRQKHPLNGQTVVGAIVAWSPSSAANAGNLRKKITSTPAKRTNLPSRIPINSDQNGTFNGQGAPADDDF
ncbi:MAG TPA: hypothetical protein P5186_03895 [Candidatus Paceibacterota bacterium]|nr:hypothetical protein [Candidatus Paceibacterota bacterium]HRZ99707.1 hypothetical protein [Candidatus Paceibacterota bacterium]